jgi:hypothetical protein
MITQAEKSGQFLALHKAGGPLLLPNPWDLGSARILASLGYQALATTSSGFAMTLGRPDGSVSRGEALAHALGLVSGPLLAVAAVAVAVPVALSGSTLSMKHPPAKIPTPLSFMVAVNGQSRVFPENGAPPGFTVNAGEGLRIDVEATVPAHLRVTALRLGISGGVISTQDSLHPILAHISKPLGPGSHRFRLEWTVPAGLRPGTLRYVAAELEVEQGHLAQFIASLTVQSS